MDSLQVVVPLPSEGLHHSGHLITPPGAIEHSDYWQYWLSTKQA